MAYNLSVINEDWVFPNSNFNYAKSSAFVDIIEDFPIESKNYKKSNPTANVYVQFSYTSDQSQVIEFIDTFNFTDNFSIEKLYAFGSLLKLKFKNINAKLYMGSYTRIFSKYNSNNSGYINWSKKEHNISNYKANN